MYKISYTAQAAKTLLKMPRNAAKRIREKLEQVAEDPYAPIPNAKKLQRRSGYRLRVGDCRVICEFNTDEIVIIVLKVTPRGKVYR